MSAEKTKTDGNEATERATEQSDDAIIEPVRAYGALTANYFEQLFSAQFDAIRAFADTSAAQSHSWLEVKDSESLRQAIEEQQQAVREMSERLKEDASKIQSLSQEYLKETQQLTTESMQKGQKQFQENLQKGQDKVEDSHKKGKEAADDTQQKNQQQTDKSKKSTSTSHK